MYSNLSRGAEKLKVSLQMKCALPMSAQKRVSLRTTHG
jgi:hypothetical protein